MSNPRGRAPRAGEASTVSKRFRCTEAEAEDFERRAEKAGKSFSEWAREKLAVPDPKPARKKKSAR